MESKSLLETLFDFIRTMRQSVHMVLVRRDLMRMLPLLRIRFKVAIKNVIANPREFTLS